MAPELILKVDDLVGHPEKSRPVRGSVTVSLRLGESSLVGPVSVEGRVVGTVDGVQVTFTAGGEANLTCSRCLITWAEGLAVEGSQHYSKVPDEDGYAITAGEIDLSGPVVDETALALPAAPLCRPDCLGLCPTCGTDLNTDPCGGHGDDSDSPFAALKDLFDP